MKMILIIMTLTSAPSVFASLECLDARATLFAPCNEGQKRVFVQGTCAKTYEIESTYCSTDGSPNCLDARATLFPPCSGETRIFVQGQCLENYEVEHSYCAKR